MARILVIAAANVGVQNMAGTHPFFIGLSLARQGTASLVVGVRDARPWFTRHRFWLSAKIRTPPARIPRRSGSGTLVVFAQKVLGLN